MSTTQPTASVLSRLLRSPMLHLFMVVAGGAGLTVYYLNSQNRVADVQDATSATLQETTPLTADETWPVETAKQRPVDLLFTTSTDSVEYTIAEQLERAEQFLLEHQPAEAAILLDELIQNSGQTEQRTESTRQNLPGRAFFLQGIAHEQLGEISVGQIAYQEAFRRTQELSQQTCLALRLADVLLQEDEAITAASMLMNLLNKHGQELPAHVRGELSISLALSLSLHTPRTLTPAELLDVRSLESVPVEVSAVDVIQSWDQVWERTSIPPVNQLEIDVAQALGDQPTEILSIVHGPVMPVEDFLNQLCARSNWILRTTDEAQFLMRGRSVSLNTAQQGLDITIDSVLLPLEIEWNWSNGELHVLSFREMAGAPSRNVPGLAELPFGRRASRYLQRAVLQAAGSSRIALAYAELARREASVGRYADAVKYLIQNTSLNLRGTQATQTWLNLGKLYLLGNERDAALQAMFRGADQLDGDMLAGTAYLFAGRMLLEQERPGEAVRQLARAISLTQGEIRGRAAMLLTIAYVMQNEFVSANKVLWDEQEAISHPAINDQAAFLVSYVRYRAAQPGEREYLARNLLTAVASAKQESTFGDVWDLLEADTYRELGLWTECRQIVEQNLQSMAATPIQDKLRKLLPDAATDIEPDSVDLEYAAEMRAFLELERQGQWTQAVEQGRHLLAEIPATSSLKPQILAVLGRCYQRQGKHAEAIRCFVGIVPDLQEVTP